MHIALTHNRTLLIVEVATWLNFFTLTLFGLTPLLGFAFLLFFFKLLGVLAIVLSLPVVVIVLTR